MQAQTQVQNSGGEAVQAPKSVQGKKSRFKSMLWSMAFIVMAAMVLPTASYLLTGAGDSVKSANAQVSGDTNQRANFWRAVRGGNEGYSAVQGAETGMLINNGGQNWRVWRDGFLIKNGKWLLVGALGLVVLFFVVRGRIKLVDRPTGATVPRWNVFERLLHWYTAILFVALAITGLSMLFGRAVLIPLVGAKGFSVWATFSINIHNTVGPFFSVGVLLMLILWVRHNIPKAVDLAWLASGGGIIGKAHPSAEKANGGEKIWFWIVILIGLLAVCGTGLVLIGWGQEYAAPYLGGLASMVETTRANMQFMHQIHAMAALIWIAIFFGHAYIGTLGTEGAIEGMTKGKVSVEWAKQHHDLWYEKVKNKGS
ncbi:MAG: formate dehydrogenase subunit gamma [Arenicellales bacterium WSBS_2016_MAG_OTU3]